METANGAQKNVGHAFIKAARPDEGLDSEIICSPCYRVNRKEIYNLCAMRINVDLPDLHALCVLADCGSFTEAAQSLALTPSAMSRRIAKVEQAIGGRLVERSTRSMRLTGLGEQLVARMKPLLKGMEEVLVNAADVAAGRDGRLAVGCIATLAQSVFPQALQAFHARFPGVRISLRDSHGAQVRQAVLAREVEFGLTQLWEPHPDLFAEAVATDAYLLVCAADHPLASRASLNWRDLALSKVLSFNPGSATRQQIDDVLLAQGIPLPWFDEVDSLSTMMGHVERGEMVAVLPALALLADANLKSIPLTQPRIERAIYLIRRHDSTPNVPTQFLWETLRRMLQQ